VSLAGLAASVATCVACPLAEGRTHAVAGEFPAGARLMLVGEAPGHDEDVSGRPFVGRAGRLLDELLDGAGLSRAEVSITNVVKCRPPDNRPPRRAELRECRSWIDRQLPLADPALVVTLGGTAAAWAFGRPVRLVDVRGRDHLLAGRVLVATFHPSAALRFGPSGAPRAGLAEDLAHAARRLRHLGAGGLAFGAVGPEIAANLLTVALAGFGTLPPLDPPSSLFGETEGIVAAELAAHPGVAAYRHGELVAGLRCRPDGSALWLRRVAVAPAEQGAGVGTCLLAWTHRWAAGLGFRETRVGVRSVLDRTRTFWQRRGYEAVAEHGYWTEYARRLGQSG